MAKVCLEESTGDLAWLDVFLVLICIIPHLCFTNFLWFSSHLPNGEIFLYVQLYAIYEMNL